jgi:hypothetical protein
MAYPDTPPLAAEFLRSGYVFSNFREPQTSAANRKKGMQRSKY